MTTPIATPEMRIAIGQFNEPSYEKLRFAQQLGVSGVLLNTPRLPGETHWEYDDLAKLRDTVNSYGLTLEALENSPRVNGRGGARVTVFDMNLAKERDAQLSHGRVFSADEMWASYEYFIKR